MSKNIIFYFSGTGNSLKVAKEISNKLGDALIIPMGSKTVYDLKGEYESIGFIFPVFFQGLPKRVRDYILDLKLPKDTYYYSIGTYGGLAGNAIAQVGHILNQKGVKLNYSVILKMFSNYILWHDMAKNIEKITEESNNNLIPLIEDIKNKKENRVKKLNGLLEWYYNKTIKKVERKAKDFNVSENCINCKICERICPVGNIVMENKKPKFLNHCEQCIACIQYCPTKAINYKNKTQSRRRYNHPDINHEELIKYNKG